MNQKNKQHSVQRGMDENIARIYNELEQERYYKELERAWRKHLFPLHKAYVDEYKRTHKEWLKIRSNDMEITELAIEQARGYPIEKLIDIDKRGYALCIDHSDENPSMYCKNNYAYCFSCGYYADTIKLYQDINNVNFVTSIKELCNI